MSRADEAESRKSIDGGELEIGKLEGDVDGDGGWRKRLTLIQVPSRIIQ